MKKDASNILLFRAARIMLVLTMGSAWLLCGLYAKYTISDQAAESTRVAAISGFELKEHAVKLESGEYTLQEEEVDENEYNTVIPGVDIPKDPFIRIKTKTEVNCYLYVKVLETNVPDTVTYEMAEGWELIETTTNKSTKTTENVYVYKDVVDSNFSGVVPLIQNNKLYVSEHYIGNDDFKLTFYGCLGQMNAGESAKEVYARLF